VWPGTTLTATAAQQQNFLFGSDSRSLASYYNDTSYGQMTWTGTETANYTITDPGTCDLYSLVTQAESAATAHGYTTASYDALLINAPKLYCGSAGYGELGGKYTWIENGLWNLDDGYARLVPAHEIGHSLGLYHSHGLECGAATVTLACLNNPDAHNEEYGNAWDVMGNNWPGDGHDSVAWFSAKQAMLLGWLNGSRVQTVTTSGTYSLVPLEKSGTSSPQVLVINAATHTYYVEYRQPLGQDAFMAQYPAATNAVHVNVSASFGSDTGPFALDFTPTADNPDYEDWYDAPLAMGRSFTEPGQTFTISPMSHDGTTASVNVTFGSSPPTVTAQSPATGATGVSIGTATTPTPMTATFSQNVTGVSRSSFTLKQGSSVVSAAVSYNAATKQAKLTPAAPLVPDRTYALSLSSAIKNAAGQPLVAQSWSFISGPRPTITATNPSSGATGVKLGTTTSRTPLTATFSEAVKGLPTTAASTGNYTLKLGTTLVASKAAYNATSRIATLTPGAPLIKDKTYTAALSSAIKDAAGNPIAAKTWTFITGPRPTVTSRTPAPNATRVGRTKNVTATFSEAVTGLPATPTASTRFTIKRTATGTAFASAAGYNATSRVATLNPTGTLLANTKYTVTLTKGIKDRAGNTLTTLSWTFTTGTS